MDTVYVKQNEISDEIMGKAAATIRSGGSLFRSTETVYGLGADGLNPAAVKRIYAAKGRPSDNPLILHISNLEMLKPIVQEISPMAKALMEKFWPGPLTMVFNKTELVPSETSGGLNTVAVRFPNHPLALKLIEKSKTPIAAPSANSSGRPSPTKAEHVLEDLDGKIDWILDGGACKIGVESTVVAVTDEVPVILRPGKITLEEIREVCGGGEYDRHLIAEKDEVVVPRAPGMKYKHYAPKGQIEILSGTTEQIQNYINAHDAAHTAVMTFTQFPVHHENLYSLGNIENPEEGCSELFDYLRTFDRLGIEHIFAVMPQKEGVGFALYNRLLKAAGGKVIVL